MPTLAEVRPSVMLIVPLIIEKIYRHQVLAKFNSSGFWRTLYRRDSCAAISIASRARSC